MVLAKQILPKGQKEKTKAEKVLLQKVDLVKKEHDHSFYILTVLPELEI